MAAKKVLIPLPEQDFDPTEAAIPWKILSSANHQITFATPNGRPAVADPIMLTGKKLGFLAPFLMADNRARTAYQEMQRFSGFLDPKRWDQIRADDFDALLLPGGHAQGMRPYLESQILQNLVAQFFEQNKPVGAICHGVVLAARSKNPSTGKSVLFGRKTTALTKAQEMLAWNLTRLWLGMYYRTYKKTVEDEAKEALQNPTDFHPGPMSILRDLPEKLERGFIVRDGNYISARWPGDAHKFAMEFLSLLDF